VQRNILRADSASCQFFSVNVVEPLTNRDVAAEGNSAAYVFEECTHIPAENTAAVIASEDLFSGITIYTDTPGGVLHFNGIDIGYTFYYYLEDDGSMVCTITGAVTGSSLLIDASGRTFVGTTTDAEDLALYFGEDLEFTLYLTDGGLVTSDDFPTVNPEYIVQNA